MKLDELKAVKGFKPAYLYGGVGVLLVAVAAAGYYFFFRGSL